ncbi:MULTISPECIES: methyltransferase domain-containing protein [Pseudomonas fluorescens group]|uniref:Tam_2 protein n=1 Tax=Pseudomonas fluorescens TaxID=294 RepID=A0A0D0RT93_PSEFL|nr:MULTISPECIES: methyltransferase domain-containing protein [Pseudomonas fluorescens group]AZE59022.1 Trans-aconitate 2-methyltransferase [Pseudomonas synxantha]KIR22772.1 Trans-aconitate 2-methyltransferase [Pseudomonas fluorescens]
MINKPKPSTAGPATTRWDPQAYLQFARLRERPVLELLDRMTSLQPRRIYDLGCGTGIATQLLAKRWPEAELIGIDSSSQMLSEASYLPIKALWYRCDVQHWQAEQPADLLFAAAVLHFINGHETLLPRLLAQLRPGGCLASHMPDWRDAPWYALMLEILEHGGLDNAPLGTPQLRQCMAERPVLSLERYYRLLAPLTTGLDIWETEHLQVVEGQSPIFEWVKVSALRPVLLALNEQERRRFLEQYLARVHQRYPPERDGHTLFPFKRIFILATA